MRELPDREKSSSLSNTGGNRNDLLSPIGPVKSVPFLPRTAHRDVLRMDILNPKAADFPLTKPCRYSKDRGREKDLFALPHRKSVPG